MREQTIKLVSIALLTAITLSGCAELNQLTEATEVTNNAGSEASAADQPKTVASLLSGPMTLAGQAGRTNVPDGGLFILNASTAPATHSTESSFDVSQVASHQSGELTYNANADWNDFRPIESPSEILCFGEEPGTDLKGIAIFQNFVLGPDDVSVTSMLPSSSPGSLKLQPSTSNAAGDGGDTEGVAAVLVSDADQAISITCPGGRNEGESAQATEFQVQKGLNVIVGEEPSDVTKPKVWRVARNNDALAWSYTTSEPPTADSTWLSLPAADSDNNQSLGSGTYDLLWQAFGESGYRTVKVGRLTVNENSTMVELDPVVPVADRPDLQAITLCPNDTSGVQIAYVGPPISLKVSTQGETGNLARVKSMAPETVSGGLSLVHANVATSGSVTRDCETDDGTRVRRWSGVTLKEGWNLLRYDRAGSSQAGRPVDVWTNADTQGIDLAWEVEPFFAPPN